MFALKTLLVVMFACAPSTEEFQLENGLTVLLRPVPQCKVMALVVLFDIGGDHDPRGKSGMAHLLEHLYCVAPARADPSRTHEQMLQLYPKGSNAQTGDRYTVYAVVFPATELERELEGAAARMGDLRITQAALQQEFPRIQAELENMFGRLPALGACNQARELLRPTPHAGRKGGRMEHLQTITAAEAQERWRTYYKPRNATLVLCGGVESQARSLIEKHFQALPSGQRIPPAADPGRPKWGQLKEVSIVSLIPESPTEIAISFQPPLPTSPDYPAFLVLARRLQIRQSKLQAGAGRFPVHFAMLDDPHTLTLSVPARPGETGKETLRRLQSFVEESHQAPLVPRETLAVQMHFGSFLGLKEPDAFELAANPYGVAFSLGRRRQLGLDGTKLRQGLEAVTDADLRRVARSVFGTDRFTGAILLPQK